MRKMSLALLLLVTLLLGACTAEIPGETAVSSNPPAPTPLPTHNPDTPVPMEVASYAEEMGVSLEEAIWRMEMQTAWAETNLSATLMENEAETFAGLWWQHEPTFQIVIAFTQDGAETVEPYLEGQPFAQVVEVRNNYAHTYQALRQVQEQTAAILEQLQVNGSVGIDVAENQVYLEVGNPGLFREEVTAAGLSLPEPVVVHPQNPDKLSDTLRGSVETFAGPAGQTVYFPRQAPTNVYLEAKVRGVLELDENGCLRLASPNDDQTALILWHADHTLRFDEEQIEVVDGDGEVLARVGEPLHGGGGYLGGERTPAIPDMPIEGCPGPYIILGELSSLETQAKPVVFVYPFSLKDSAQMGQFYAQSAPAPAGGIISGPLTATSLCLQVDGYTVLWPPDVYPDEDAEPMTIVYRSAEEELVMGAVGESFTLAGSERTAGDYRYFENKVGCPGPYWGVYEIE